MKLKVVISKALGPDLPKLLASLLLSCIGSNL